MQRRVAGWGLVSGFFLWCLLRASLELRNAEQALQGNEGGGRGTSTAGVASSVGGERKEGEVLAALVVVLSEGTPEAHEASSFPCPQLFVTMSLQEVEAAPWAGGWVLQ